MDNSNEVITNEITQETTENIFVEQNTIEEETVNNTEENIQTTEETQIITQEISLENVETLLQDVITMQSYNYTVNLYLFTSVIIVLVIYLLYRFISHFIDF